MEHDHEEAVTAAPQTPKKTMKRPVEPAARPERAKVDLDAALGSVDARHAPGTNTTNAVTAASSALRYIRSSASKGLHELEASTEQTRSGVVVALVLELNNAIDDIAVNIEHIPRDQRTRLQDAADSAADAVHTVWDWIHTRSPNAELVDTFSSSVSDFDRVLRSIGVTVVGRRPKPTQTGDEVREANRERVAVTRAASNLKNAIEAEKEQLLAGVEQFSKLAAIDDREPPTFVEAVAQSLLVAAAGHMFGGAMGSMLTRLTETAGRAITRGAHEMFVNVQTDAFQGFASTLLAARNEAATATVARARVYFESGLTHAATIDAKLRMNAVDRLVEANSASPVLLEAETTRIGAGDAQRMAQYAQTAAHLWALYQAQSTLGSHGKLEKSRGGISRMNDYFGVGNAAGDREPGTSHAGTRGVARIAFIIEEGVAEAKPTGFEIAGSNHEIASMVAARAGHTFDGIWLPKEVSVYLGHYRAVIAIDEQNRVRDSLGWDDLARASGHRPHLASPHLFWNTVRGSRVE